MINFIQAYPLQYPFLGIGLFIFYDYICIVKDSERLIYYEDTKNSREKGRKLGNNAIRW